MFSFISTQGKEYKVYFKHSKEEVPKNPAKAKSKAHQRPYGTMCIIMQGEKRIARTASVCRTDLESFKYKYGRKRALERALKQAHFKRPDRTLAWKSMWRKQGIVAKTMKVFDCSSMPKDLKDKFFAVVDKGANDVYVGWYLGDGGFGDDKERFEVDKWLLDNGAAKDEHVLIRHSW